MIERKFVKEKLKEFRIGEFIGGVTSGAGYSHANLKKTPLGEKIIIHASRPGLVVGRKGAHMKELTEGLKGAFELENPQIEIAEVDNSFLDAKVVAERIVSSLERFGSSSFKRIAYQTVENVMKAGAYGVEILLSGKIPGARAKTWRFWQGYMKKSGSVSQSQVDIAKKVAKLKTGIIGVVVMILPPGAKLPDAIKVEQEDESLERIEKAKKAGSMAQQDIDLDKEVQVEEVDEETKDSAAQETEKPEGKTDEKSEVKSEKAAEEPQEKPKEDIKEEPKEEVKVEMKEETKPTEESADES